MIFVQTNDARENELLSASASIQGFTLAGHSIAPLARSLYALPDGAGPAQIAFAPDGDSIVSIELDGDGLPRRTAILPSAGRTPHGFDFAGGTLVVTEAFGGQVGAAAASSYRVNGTIEPVSAPALAALGPAA
ncbi:MAG TPA: hypothetical protein VGK79_17365 [Gaiellaceae bacterium]